MGVGGEKLVRGGGNRGLEGGGVNPISLGFTIALGGWGGASHTPAPTLGNTANDLGLVGDGNLLRPAVVATSAAQFSTCASALQFQGSATDFSTNNAADYLLIGSPIVFFNNAGASFTVIPPLPTVTITASGSQCIRSPRN